MRDSTPTRAKIQATENPASSEFFSPCDLWVLGGYLERRTAIEATENAKSSKFFLCDLWVLGGYFERSQKSAYGSCVGRID